MSITADKDLKQGYIKIQPSCCHVTKTIIYFQKVSKAILVLFIVFDFHQMENYTPRAPRTGLLDCGKLRYVELEFINTYAFYESKLGQSHNLLN